MTPTPMQLDVLSSIREYRYRHGYAPTLQEIADEHGVSRVTIFWHVKELQCQGIIRTTPGMARSIEIINDVEPVKSRSIIPVLGIIGHWKPKAVPR